MDTDVGSAGGVEIVHGNYVLVIVGSGDRLVRKTPAVRDGIKVESAGRIVACRYGEDDSAVGNVNDRREPSPTAGVIGDLRV